MKTFLLTASELKVCEILKSFLRKKSLFSLRSEMRGRLGLPRMRTNDSVSVDRASLRRQLTI